MIEIDPGKDMGVYEYVGLKDFIASLFDGPVDVVTRENLKPYVHPQLSPRRCMPSKSPELALHDILHHVDLATSWTDGFTLETFIADQRTMYAVTRCLEIFSEASRRLPADLKARHPSCRSTILDRLEGNGRSRQRLSP